MFMTPEKFDILKENIISQLRVNLLPGLFYHSPEHTLDVINAAENIGVAEKINDKDMMLLKTAALFHDSGYLFTAKNHEDNSCRIARFVLPDQGFNEDEINIICDLIMATKMPQSPKNILSEILCDADLDYLGRDDFYELSRKLYEEMNVFKKVESEHQWNEIQISFFEKHHYFTATSRSLRTPIKEKHLSDIKNNLQEKI